MCVFCEIVKGNIPSTKVYEDERVMVFKDINPMAKVHLIVIPKAHYDSLAQCDDPLLMGHLLRVIRQVAIEAGLQQEGYRVVTNIGENGGQTVGHLHFHLLGGELLSGSFC